MRSKKRSNEQLCVFCSALSHLIRAGIGLGDALTLLSQDEPEEAFRKTLQEMARQADEGTALTQLLRAAGCFPAYVCTLMEVGERVGRCEQTLAGLARYYEGRCRMDRRSRDSMLYPSMLMLVLLAVAVILLVWVLPIFNDVYAQLGRQLTGVAGGLLQFGVYLRQGLPVLCLVVAAVGAMLAIGPLRDRLTQLWNSLRGDRGIRRQIMSARFVQALSMAVESGMTPQEAVQLASTLGESGAFALRCDRCLQQVTDGKTLSAALSENDFLSKADRRLLDAATRSGKTESVLQEISLRMLERSEEALERRMGYTEPILVAVACGLIGAVLLSVMLPLMQIMTAIG